MRHIYKKLVVALLLSSPLLAIATVSPAAAQTTPPSDSCVNLSRNLSRGDSGSDVTDLQNFLVEEDLLDAANVSGFYGALTESAVKQWQSSHGIASSGSPDTNGYGAVGPHTRAEMACDAGTTKTTTPPTGTTPVPNSTQCPTIPKPEPCLNSVAVQLSGCTVGWQCSVTTLPDQTFDATPKSGQAPFTVNFIGVVTSANAGACPNHFCASTLAFGDGSVGAVPLPSAPDSMIAYRVSHTYVAGGSFVATLYQGSAGSGAPLVGTPIAISIGAPTSTPPVGPTITATPNFGNAPLPVSFVVTNIPSNNNVSVEFGDGTFGSVQQLGANAFGVAHTYSSGGTYTAKLRRTSGAGDTCTTANCPVLASVGVSATGGVGSTPQMIATPSIGPAPFAVIFSLNGGNTVYSNGVIMDFGDGTTEIMCYPGAICGQKTIQHTYIAASIYNVQMLAIGQGSSVVLKTATVQATTVGATSLTASPATGPVPFAVTFTGNGGSQTYANGVILKYGDDSAEVFCTPGEICVQKTKTHTYTEGNQFSPQLIGLLEGSASSTIGSTVVTATGGTLKVRALGPIGPIRKGDTVPISWRVSGTRPASGSISFDLYTRAGARIGTILTITNFQTGTANWKVPSSQDKGCTSTQPNGLCGVNIVPGDYTIQPNVSGVNPIPEIGTLAQITIQDELVNQSSFTVSVTPTTAELGKSMSIKYRVANPPYQGGIALWLVKSTGENMGLIEGKLDIDTELTTYPWTAGKLFACPQSIFNPSISCTTVVTPVPPGSYNILAKIYTPFSANFLAGATSTDVVFNAIATSTAFSITAPGSGAGCVVLNNNLAPGDTDATTGGEVSKLQQFLAQDTDIYPEGTISGFYGPATRRAVERFQSANNILTSGSPDTNGYGAVGPRTRATIATKCNSTDFSFRATPKSGRVPLVVNFTAKPKSDTTKLSIDFGDGSSGDMSIAAASTPTASAQHGYTTNGTFIAKLMAATSSGSQTLVGAASIVVDNSTTPPPDSCAKITRTLVPEDTDAATGGEVSKLQQFLALDSDIYPEGLITGFYGPATVRAVKRYQAANNITQTGTVGPLTLAAMKCPGEETHSELFTATPTSGAAGLQVRFTTNIDFNAGSFRINFGDGSVQWLTSSSTVHTYTFGGRFTAELISSVGNCFGLTGDALRICEIGSSQTMASIPININQAPNALNVAVSPAGVNAGAPLSISWTTQNPPANSKVRLEVYPEGATESDPKTNNDQGIAADASNLAVNGSYTWTVPASGVGVADGGWGGFNLTPGVYHITAKVYTGSTCWGYCSGTVDRTVSATAKSTGFNVGGGTTGVPTFSWSSSGTLLGRSCTQVNEPNDSHTWTDNFFCASRDIGMRWSSSGQIAGMRCTLVNEPSDHDGWSDNYICIPTASNFFLRWSYAGTIPGLACTQWSEAADPDAWSDNYMCVSSTSGGGSAVSASVDCRISSADSEMLRVRLSDGSDHDFFQGTGEGVSKQTSANFPAVPVSLTAYHGGAEGSTSGWTESTTLVTGSGDTNISVASEDGTDGDYNDLVCTVSWQ